MIERARHDRDQILMTGQPPQPVAHHRQRTRGEQFITTGTAGKFHVCLSAALRGPTAVWAKWPAEIL